MEALPCQHYAYLSKYKYGFDVSPLRPINALGFHLLDSEPNKGCGVQVSSRWYPKDAYSYHNLAKAYAAVGKIDNAIDNQATALELAENMTTWHQKQLRKKLDGIKRERVSGNNTNGVCIYLFEVSVISAWSPMVPATSPSLNTCF